LANSHLWQRDYIELEAAPELKDPGAEVGPLPEQTGPSETGPAEEQVAPSRASVGLPKKRRGGF